MREVFDVGWIEDGWAGYTNPIPLIVVHWKVQLLGMSSAILDWLNQLKPTRPVIN